MSHQKRSTEVSGTEDARFNYKYAYYVYEIRDEIFKYLQGAIKYKKWHSTCDKELLEMKNTVIKNWNSMGKFKR